VNSVTPRKQMKKTDTFWDNINNGEIPVLKYITTTMQNNKKITKIKISEQISYIVFKRVLEFLYTGSATFANGNNEVRETADVAALIDCQDLVTYCNNILSGNEFLNPSITTWLNDKFGEKALELFFNKPLLSDVSFQVENVTMHAHRAVVSSRSEVINAMLQSKFIEGKSNSTIIRETSFECFKAFMEYLYTAHAPIEQSEDKIGIMEISNRFGVSRLVTLCELYASKEVEKATTDGIESADIDIINLLLVSQKCNANQLAAFCLHFISNNYQPMKKRKEFVLLEGDNLKYVQEHQWPPVSYLQQLAEYEKLTGHSSDNKCLIM